MTISDIIAIFGLVIAIVAIISEKNRKHLLLKFSHFDFLFYIVGFLLINYFIFYDYFFEHGIIIEFLYFDNFGFEDPKNFSYIFSLLILGSVVIKIFSSFYPSKKRDDVEKYYIGLIETNDILILCDLINKYHTKDIVDYIQKTDLLSLKDRRKHFGSEINRIPKIDFLKIKMNNLWKKINKYSKINRHGYAIMVLYNIINSAEFIRLTANMRPHFFSNIISNFKKEYQGKFPGDLVNKFLSQIIKENNFGLINEVKQAQNFGSGLNNNFFRIHKILNSIISDLTVAEVNEIWRPFGEGALQEIGIERNKGDNSEFKFAYQNEDEFWNNTIFLSINFFNTLIIEAITKKYKSHFFLAYYWYFTDRILKNLELSPPANFGNVQTRYHYLINKMNDNIFIWLNLANNFESDRFIDIMWCLGNQINSLTNSTYFGEARSINLIDNLLNFYCKLKDNKRTGEFRKLIEKVFLRPSMLTNQNDNYYGYIKEAWRKFDKIPHKIGNEDLDYLKRLKNNVIIPLELDPNIH